MTQKRSIPLLDDNPMFIRDYDKCVMCWRCIQVCAEDAQYTFAINFSERGYFSQIGTFFDKSLPETTCVFCGQCVGVCPSGALKPKREWQLEVELKSGKSNSNSSKIFGKINDSKRINNSRKHTNGDMNDSS